MEPPARGGAPVLPFGAAGPVKALISVFTTYLSAITAEAHKAGRIKEGDPATVNREVAYLRHVLNLAVRWGYLRENPVRGVKMLSEPPGWLRYLAEEEKHRLLRAWSDQLRPIVACVINAGMRKRQFLAPHWANENRRERRVIIRGFKTSELRTIPINDCLLREPEELPRHLQSDFCISSWQRYPLPRNEAKREARA